MSLKSHVPKILVFSPTYEGKEYIFDAFYKGIKSIDYPNWEFLMIDNTEGMSYTHKLRQRGINTVHVPRCGNSRQALCNAQNYARKYAIENDFDYILSIESDIICTPDVIQRLLKHDKKVVGGLYYIGHEVKIPCIFFVEKMPTGAFKTSLIKLQDVPHFINTGLQQVHGMGVGCTLVRRDIFTKYMFWFDERFDNKHSDVYFYMELQNDGVPVFCDTDLILTHHPSDWNLVQDR